MRAPFIFPAVVIGWLLIPAAHSADQPKVFFFGGATSKAKTINSCYPDVTAFDYPPTSKVALAAAEMNEKGNRDKPYVVVCHSSGCKFANKLAQEVANPSRLTMVNFDGFAPDAVPKAARRICWKAENGRGLLSPNAASRSPARNCGEVRTLKAPHCTTAWCLHFALVNLNVPGSLNDGTWISQGYKNCKPHTPWMTPAAATPAPVAPPAGDSRGESSERQGDTSSAK